MHKAGRSALRGVKREVTDAHPGAGAAAKVADVPINTVNLESARQPQRGGVVGAAGTNTGEDVPAGGAKEEPKPAPASGAGGAPVGWALTLLRASALNSAPAWAQQSTPRPAGTEGA